VNSFSDKGCEILNEILIKNQKIEIINLGYNSITSKGIQNMKESLSKNNSITEIDLGSI
jgi:Ran GTPase-activating protein (RanGAP) involved in mRNA processing and transport